MKTAFENRLTILIARQITLLRLLLCTFLVFGLFSYSANTWASEPKSTIIWQTVHIPPASIKSGPLEGEGFIQLILKQITDEMPEYHHEYAITTLARTTVDLKAGKNVCHPSLLATEERKAWAVFSHSNIFNPNNHFIVSRDLIDSFVEPPVSVEYLKSKPKFTYAIIKQRAYGSLVDDLLENYVSEQQKLIIASDNLSNIFRLIANRKVDLTIAYPFELMYFIQNNPKFRDQIKLLPIEGVPKYIVGSIACAKTPWGEEVIKSVNQALATVKPTQRYKDAMTRWWPLSSVDLGFEQFYHEVFLNQ